MASKIMKISCNFRLLANLVLLLGVCGLSAEPETVRSDALSRDISVAIPAIDTLRKQKDAVTILKVFQQSPLQSARLAAVEALREVGGMSEAKELIQAFAEVNAPPYEGGSEAAGAKRQLKEAFIKTIAVLCDVSQPHQMDQQDLESFLETCRMKLSKAK